MHGIEETRTITNHVTGERTVFNYRTGIAVTTYRGGELSHIARFARVNVFTVRSRTIYSDKATRAYMCRINAVSTEN